MSLKFLCFYQSRSVWVSLDAIVGVLGGLGGPRGAPRGPGGHGFNRLLVLQGALWGLLFIFLRFVYSVS